MTTNVAFDCLQNRAESNAIAQVGTALKSYAERLADMVVAALIDEVTLTPKPGLVDLRSRGAHHDLSWELMCHSAWALHPTFWAMAQAGQTIPNTQQLREEIGRLGRAGEVQMMAATKGVNTHRGAIWALGLLVTAAAQDKSALTATAVSARAAVLARCPDQFAPIITGNNGERACQVYGVGGARAQAQAGFPHVISVALPALKHWREHGEGELAAQLNALLSVIAELDDTCILSRGGMAALLAVQAGAEKILKLGGAASAQGNAALQVFEDDLLARHVSPGGAADLLAAALFLDRLTKEIQV
ncbi:triphosphoribosyl-dephospho-CoA synthase [Glaciimonas immobilis]|uniref:Probable 2-(5''-triphosphoribosyl)-3'-dephosphocoenzyme-A synthase n=1 Tax=Glaciimonas immobilis TaxID=728004 RepID=A0A840RPF0_9BURK|nr:triphosphoribosyl-dephospho-CoA synthase [Glaciimonas immobilis]KAF3999079.1 triphosphoribosyl-dephospho-CoA synthase [Glaciimonas immobilis]MBB5198511.1 triphosphoribosyl-dephospho-CoA synthase [Glaciimonas immobilis]